VAIAPPRKNPYSAFNFVLEDTGGRFGNNQIAGFMECTGLDGENTPIEYREGTDQRVGGGAFVRKLPGMERYPNVVLKRGITGDLALWLWRKNIRNADKDTPSTLPLTGTTELVDILVRLQDEKHNTVMTWRLKNPWICKLSGPALNAKGNEIAIEMCEICCDRIEIVDS
jgi:phage tail-like protein